MSIEKVKEYLSRWGREKDVMEFPVSSATVELAAQAVGVIPARIAKTLTFKQEGGAIVLVTAGDARIDNKKFKAQFKCRPQMIPIADVENLIGHAVGGVCPFAVNEGVPIYFDASLNRFDVIYPAAGNDKSCAHFKIDELDRYIKFAGRVDVSKPK